MGLNEAPPQISLSELLRKLDEMRGSDLHITTGSAPQIRVDGHLRPIEGYRTLTSADTKQLAYSVLTDAQKHRFEESLELRFLFWCEGTVPLSRKHLQPARRGGSCLSCHSLRDQSL